MENLHKSETRIWISSRINVKKFRDDWALAFCPERYKFCKDSLSETEYAELEEACGLSSMKCSCQDNMEITKDLTIPENVDLETLRWQQADLEKRGEDVQYETVVYVNSKFHNYPPLKIVDYEATSSSDDAAFVEVKQPDVLLTVQIYRPLPKNNPYLKKHVGKFPIFQIDQEFMVLGSQYLTELRDKIDCVSDKAVPGDYSEHPNLPPEMTCKDLYKSGFFYIDGVFYNDMRDGDCRDYSDPILTWAASKNRGVGPFQKTLMENTKFVDLNLQLGYPYLYVHQGHCEHLIVFCDLLMHTQHYSINRNDYPVRTALKQKKMEFCMLCRIHPAEWIVFDNKRIPENPFFFCKQCFFSYNYNKKKQKVGNFRAYHHVDRSSIL